MTVDKAYFTIPQVILSVLICRGFHFPLPLTNLTRVILKKSLPQPFKVSGLCFFTFDSHS